MVDYESQIDEGETFGVKQLTRKDKIRRRIYRALDQCKEGDAEMSIHSSLTIEELYIYGSLARGQAVKGESDLDIMIGLSNNMQKELTFIESNVTENCMNKKEDMIIRDFDKTFAGADIQVVPRRVFFLQLLRFVADEKPRVAWDLEESRIDDEDIIVEKIADDMNEGIMDLDAIDEKELEVMPITEYSKDALLRAKREIGRGI